MKTKNAKVTINAILAVMKPGTRYTAGRLATRLGAPVSSVRQVLSTDVALARLDAHSAHQGRVYSLAGTSRMSGAHVDNRIRPDLTSNLSEYARTLDAHRALAMTTRGAP
ncbi:hypothetical protein C7405_101666 [Paraburkholderia caballeronis]|uniref:hypothetical protein n=1 Tax=Paraburkholderia caballeronis TaxID=416943 RepID=UPI0010664845|nr:hypothetical protein [Paraburkholderia caballeronis]TDV39547.1 hypothetical protein C7405_101666 [Paraburkholderia caballeronis]